MHHSYSQGNPLISLNTELVRKLRNNKRLVNEGVHDQETLLEWVNDEAGILNQPPHRNNGNKAME